MFGVSFGKKAVASAVSSAPKASATEKKEAKEATTASKKKPFYLDQANADSLRVQKKPGFFLDKDFLLVGMLFLIVLFGSKGFALMEAPEQVVVSNNASFLVDITNESASQVPLQLNFYSPLSASISAPRYIAPNEKVTAKITLTFSNSNNNYTKGTQLAGTIEARLGTKVEQKPVTLIFEQNNNALSAFFSFGAFTKEIEKFTMFEWIAFWVLIIIAAVLLLGFIARAQKNSGDVYE
jgi:hypothetical protein